MRLDRRIYRRYLCGVGTNPRRCPPAWHHRPAANATFSISFVPPVPSAGCVSAFSFSLPEWEVYLYPPCHLLQALRLLTPRDYVSLSAPGCLRRYLLAILCRRRHLQQPQPCPYASFDPRKYSIFLDLNVDQRLLVEIHIKLTKGVDKFFIMGYYNLISITSD